MKLRALNLTVIAVAIGLLVLLVLSPTMVMHTVVAVVSVTISLIILMIYSTRLRHNHHRRLEALKHIKNLQQAEKDKTEILSLVAHQLKTPLALIRWSAESVLNNPELTAKERQRLEQVIASCQVMYHTVEDLSHIFKLTSGDGQGYLRFDTIDVNALVKEMLAEYQAVADQHQIKIVVREAEAGAKIKADRIFLKHDIANLVDNAIQYSPHGSEITVSITRVRNEVQIAVADHGMGIEPANMDRIFERFYRTPKAIKVNEHGTGLGLFLVKTITKKMGGRVSVQSELGKGSTFTLTFAAI